MKKVSLILLVCLTLSCASGCISETKSVKTHSVTTDNAVHTISINPDGRENLAKTVTLVKSDMVDCNDYNVSMVGMTFDKSSGNAIRDAMNIGTGLNTDTKSVDRGFDIGFKNSSDKEIEKKDAYLCLYLKFTFDSAEVSQRNSVIPDVKVSIKDDQGEEFSLIHYSMKDTYVDTNYPYGLMMFKGFYDSKFAYITINWINFEIDLAKLK